MTRAYLAVAYNNRGGRAACFLKKGFVCSEIFSGGSRFR